MSPDEYSIQGNNGNNKLNKLGNGIHKELIDKKYHKLFDIFDTNHNGKLDSGDKINGEGITLFEQVLKEYAGDDNILQTSESEFASAVFNYNFNMKDADYAGFVKAVSDVAGTVEKEEESILNDGCKKIVTQYKGGLTITSIYYPDGELKLEHIEEHRADTTTSYTVGSIEYSKEELDKVIKKDYEKKLAEYKKNEAKKNAGKEGLNSNISENEIPTLEEYTELYMKKNKVLENTNSSNFDRSETRFSERAKEEIRNYTAEYLNDTADKTYNTVQQWDYTNGDLSKISMVITQLLEKGWEEVKGLFTDVNEQDFKTYAKIWTESKDAKEKANILLSAAKFENLKDTPYVQAHPELNTEFSEEFQRATGNEFKYETGYTFQQTAQKYTEVTGLKQRTELLEKGIERVKRLYENERVRKQGFSVAEDGENYRDALMGVLTEYFNGDKEMAATFVSGYTKEMTSAEEIDKNLLQLLQGIKKSAEENYAKLLDGEKYEDLSERYHKEYREYYGVEDNQARLEELMGEAASTRGLIKIGGVMVFSTLSGAALGTSAISNGLKALAERYGANLVKQGVRFAMTMNTVAVDTGIEILDALSSEAGLTDSKTKEIVEIAKGAAKYIFFGSYVAGPLAQNVSKKIAEFGKLDNAFSKGTSVVTAEGTTTSVTGEQFLKGIMENNKYLGKAGALVTEIGAYAALDLTTEEVGLKDALTGSANMMVSLKVLSRILQTLMGGRVNEAVDVAFLNTAIKRAKLDKMIMTETKLNDGSVKYGVEFDGKRYEASDINDLAALITTRLAIAGSTVSGAEGKPAPKYEVKADEKTKADETPKVEDMTKTEPASQIKTDDNSSKPSDVNFETAKRDFAKELKEIYAERNGKKSYNIFNAEEINKILAAIDSPEKLELADWIIQFKNTINTGKNVITLSSYTANEIVEILNVATSSEKIGIIEQLVSIMTVAPNGNEKFGISVERIKEIISLADTPEKIDLLDYLIPMFDENTGSNLNSYSITNILEAAKTPEMASRIKRIYELNGTKIDAYTAINHAQNDKISSQAEVVSQLMAKYPAIEFSMINTITGQKWLEYSDRLLGIEDEALVNQINNAIKDGNYFDVLHIADFASYQQGGYENMNPQIREAMQPLQWYAKKNFDAQYSEIQAIQDPVERQKQLEQFDMMIQAELIGRVISSNTTPELFDAMYGKMLSGLSDETRAQVEEINRVTGRKYLPLYGHNNIADSNPIKSKVISNSTGRAKTIELYGSLSDEQKAFVDKHADIFFVAHDGYYMDSWMKYVKDMTSADFEVFEKRKFEDLLKAHENGDITPTDITELMKVNDENWIKINKFGLVDKYLGSRNNPENNIERYTNGKTLKFIIENCSDEEIQTIIDRNILNLSSDGKNSLPDEMILSLAKLSDDQWAYLNNTLGIFKNGILNTGAGKIEDIFEGIEYHEKAMGIIEGQLNNIDGNKKNIDNLVAHGVESTQAMIQSGKLFSGLTPEERAQYEDFSWDKGFAQVDKIKQTVLSAPDKYINGEYETPEELNRAIENFFQLNGVRLAKFSMYADREAIDNLMRRRFADVREYLEITDDFNIKDYELLQSMINSTNISGKPFMPTQKVEFIDLIQGYKLNGLSLDKLKPDENNRLDVAQLNIDLFHQIMRNSGMSEEEISSIPIDKLTSWDTKYTHLLAKEINGEFDQEGDAMHIPTQAGDRAFTDIIRAANLHDFKEYIHDENNIYGKTNKITQSQFSEMNMRYDKWVNPSKEHEVQFKSHDRNTEQISQIATQLAEDINKMLEFKKDASGNDIEDKPTKMLRGFFKKQFPQFFKGDEFVLPAEYTTNKAKLEELINILSDTSEKGQLAQIWNRATNNAKSDKPEVADRAGRTVLALSHLKQRAEDIAKAEDVKAAKTLDLTIKMWNRNPQEDLFQGNYSTCCIGMGGGNGFAMPHYLMDTAYNMIEIRDNNTGKIIGNALCYFVKGADGKPAFIIDNVEIANSMKPSDEVGIQLRNAITEYANNVVRDVTGKEDTPIYMGKSYNDVPIGDLQSHLETVTFVGDMDGDMIYMDLFDGPTERSEFTSSVELLELKGKEPMEPTTRPKENTDTKVQENTQTQANLSYNDVYRELDALVDKAEMPLEEHSSLSADYRIQNFDVENYRSKLAGMKSVKDESRVPTQRFNSDEINTLILLKQKYGDIVDRYINMTFTVEGSEIPVYGSAKDIVKMVTLSKQHKMLTAALSKLTVKTEDSKGNEIEVPQLNADDIETIIRAWEKNSKLTNELLKNLASPYVDQYYTTDMTPNDILEIVEAHEQNPTLTRELMHIKDDRYLDSNGEPLPRVTSDMITDYEENGNPDGLQKISNPRFYGNQIGLLVRLSETNPKIADLFKNEHSGNLVEEFQKVYIENKNFIDKLLEEKELLNIEGLDNCHYVIELARAQKNNPELAQELLHRTFTLGGETHKMPAHQIIDILKVTNADNIDIVKKALDGYTYTRGLMYPRESRFFAADIVKIASVATKDNRDIILKALERKAVYNAVSGYEFNEQGRMQAKTKEVETFAYGADDIVNLARISEIDRAVVLEELNKTERPTLESWTTGSEKYVDVKDIYIKAMETRFGAESDFVRLLKESLNNKILGGENFRTIIEMMSSDKDTQTSSVSIGLDEYKLQLEDKLLKDKFNKILDAYKFDEEFQSVLNDLYKSLNDTKELYNLINTYDGIKFDRTTGEKISGSDKLKLFKAQVLSDYKLLPSEDVSKFSKEDQAMLKAYDKNDVENLAAEKVEDRYDRAIYPKYNAKQIALLLDIKAIDNKLYQQLINMHCTDMAGGTYFPFDADNLALIKEISAKGQEYSHLLKHLFLRMNTNGKAIQPKYLYDLATIKDYVEKYPIDRIYDGLIEHNLELADLEKYIKFCEKYGDEVVGKLLDNGFSLANTEIAADALSPEFINTMLEDIRRIKSEKGITSKTLMYCTSNDSLVQTKNDDRWLRGDDLYASVIDEEGNIYKLDKVSGRVVSVNLGQSKTVNIADGTTSEVSISYDKKMFGEREKDVPTYIEVYRNAEDGTELSREKFIEARVPGNYEIYSYGKDSKGNSRKYLVGLAEYDANGGVHIEKNVESLSGTKTQTVYAEDAEGNRYSYYKITNKDNKVLYQTTDKFTKLSENHYQSVDDGQGYDIEYFEDKVVITKLDENNNKTNEKIEFKIKDFTEEEYEQFNAKVEEQEKELEENFSNASKGAMLFQKDLGKIDVEKIMSEMGIEDNTIDRALIPTLKNMSGEEYFNLINRTKIIIGGSQYSGNAQSLGGGISVSKELYGNLGTILHEAGHEHSFELSLTEMEELQKIYDKEKEVFTSAYPQELLVTVDYFLADNQVSMQNKNNETIQVKQQRGMEETDAETKLITKYKPEADVMQDRTAFLQQHFAETIAYIANKYKEHKHVEKKSQKDALINPIHNMHPKDSHTTTQNPIDAKSLAQNLTALNSINKKDIPYQYRDMWRSCVNRAKNISDKLAENNISKALIAKCDELIKDLEFIKKNVPSKVKEGIENALKELNAAKMLEINNDSSDSAGVSLYDKYKSEIDNLKSFEEIEAYKVRIKKENLPKDLFGILNLKYLELQLRQAIPDEEEFTRIFESCRKSNGNINQGELKAAIREAEQRRHNPELEQLEAELRSLVSGEEEFQRIMNSLGNSRNVEHLKRAINFEKEKVVISKFTTTREIDTYRQRVSNMNMSQENKQYIYNALATKKKLIIFNQKVPDIDIRKQMLNNCKNPDGSIDFSKLEDEVCMFQLRNYIKESTSRQDCHRLREIVQRTKISFEYKLRLLTEIRVRESDFISDDDNVMGIDGASGEEVYNFMRGDMYPTIFDDVRFQNLGLKQSGDNNYIYEQMEHVNSDYEHLFPNLMALGETSLRGRNIVTLPKEILDEAEAMGLSCIIDLRTEASGDFNNSNIDYFYFPISFDPSCDTSVIKNLGGFFDRMEAGNLYIGCANGIHRTDLAIALNYAFNTECTEIPVLASMLRRDLAGTLHRIYVKIMNLTPQERAEYGLTDVVMQKLPKTAEELDKRIKDIVD